MNQVFPRSRLKEYDLYYDGTCSIETPDQVISLVSQGVPCAKIFCESVTEALQQYNRLVPSRDKIKQKTNFELESVDWTIPEKYLNLDIKQEVVNRFTDYLSHSNFSEEEISKRNIRLIHELKLFEDNDLFPILKVLLYVIDCFKRENIVWGIGRGSSVSSYILYIIGVHDVDSVLFDLPLSDFFH